MDPDTDCHTSRQGQGAVVHAVLAGVVTAVVLGGLLLAAWAWQPGWRGWSELGHPVGFGAVLVALPAFLVGFWVDCRLRRRETVSRHTDAMAASRENLVRTRRTLRVQEALTHVWLRAEDEAALLTRSCAVLVAAGGYAVAWVAMIEPGPDKKLRVAARAGESAAFLDTLDVRFDDSPRGRGPTGVAVRENRPVTLSDCRTSAAFAAWTGQNAAMARIASAVALPLHQGDTVVGAVTLYSAAARADDRDEVDFLTLLAADLSQVLATLRACLVREREGAVLRHALRVSAAMTASARKFVTGSPDLPGMAVLIVRQAIALTASVWGGVALTSRRSGRLHWLAAADRQGELSLSLPEVPEQFPDDAGRYHGPLAAVLNTGDSLCCNEATSLEGSSPRTGEAARVRRFVAVPLRARGDQVVGLLLLADGNRPYVDRDVRAVKRLALLLEMGMCRRRAEEEASVARQRAAVANEARTQFLANISQELRTPINGILGMTQLAMLEQPSPEEADAWRTVREATDKLVEIVDNLLDLAGVETGALSPVLREFSLHRILESLRGAFSVRAGLAGLALEVEATLGIPDKLFGDPFRLRQILTNLLDNALRFTPTGAVSVRVAPYKPAAGGPRRVFVAENFQGISLLFTVSDTGIGIAPERLALIFESFTLGEDILTKRFGGAGMGLAIAKRLTDLLGGSIWVESQSGAGSTFFVAMPFWPAVPAAGAHSESVAAETVPPSRFLVVEDEAVNRLALVQGLRRLGHTVFEAANGEDALRQLTRERVDVVVMDVQMPVMDGLTAVGHIRGGEVPGANRRLPVVALTAYALEGDRKRFLDAGMDELVTKPCDMGHLLQVVAKVIADKTTA